MRILALVLAFAAFAPAARADDPKLPPAKKAKKVIQFDDEPVPGRVPKPGVAVVIPRDPSAKKALDADSHLNDVAERK